MSQVARRYARALYEEAERTSKLDAVDDDVELIRASLENARELRDFFKSPIISREKKEVVVTELFENRVDALTLRFLKLLIAKQRETIFPEIVVSYRDMRDAHLGIVRAKARVATPLSEPDRKQLVNALERMTDKNVRLEIEQDPDLLGGVVIRIGDTVYDGSVRHHLERLREQMETGGFSLN